MRLAQRSIWIALVAIVLLVGVAASYYWLAGQKEDPDVLEGNGQVRGTEVTISAKIPGTADVVAVREGQLIKKGDVIAAISSREIEARLTQATAQAAAAASQLLELEAQLEALDKAIEQARLGTGVVRESSAHGVHQATEAVDRASAEILAAEAQVEQDRKSLARFDKLAEQGFISPSYLDEVKTRLRMSEARLEASRKAQKEAQAALERARAAGGEVAVKAKDVERLTAERRRLVASRGTLTNQQAAAQGRVTELESVLADTQLFSPINATVVSRLAEPGELVAAGRPIATLIDLNDLYVRVYIAQREIGKVRLGNKAQIYADSFADQPFAGEVSEIAQRAEFTPKEVHMKDEREKLVFGVKVRIENPEGRLKPGMPVDVKIRWRESPQT